MRKQVGLLHSRQEWVGCGAELRMRSGCGGESGRHQQLVERMIASLGEMCPATSSTCACSDAWDGVGNIGGVGPAPVLGLRPFALSFNVCRECVGFGGEGLFLRKAEELLSCMVFLSTVWW